MGRSPKSDPQREAVYRWEGLRIGGYEKTAQPVAALRSLAAVVCKKYRVRKPPVHFIHDPGAKWAGIVNVDALALNRHHDGRNVRVLLHELAHWIVFAHDPKLERVEAHGPEWLGLYLWLLDWAGVEPLCASLPSARAAGLKYRHPRYCAPGRFKLPRRKR